ncbi:MAG: protoporphyrinogen oxidase HemJ [Rhodospirillaceae bacterium]|nr:protoporphyrinogen oxidase HemJ [Rhodospirillaceae bacterium]MBL6930371.1 protoporphyrinogen oxidase HemJ [Rhodospirillales bacterium]MBL6941152.1 protoporphyrinogen oxidase HemJ [Rhodospirillales bacterium]
MEFSGDAYLWIKAGHIISVIAWMAGLLYLPRLFVYHCGVGAGSEASEIFKVMERRLLRAIMYPAMLSSLLFGGLLLADSSTDWSAGWLHVKLLCVVGLMAIHMMMGGWRRAFEADANTKSEKFFRITNEVPTILMIIIVLVAVLKPW